jgi:hypothetical protein
LISHRFFQNKAAVAGTFSAVGVLALIVMVWATTGFLRRRRAQKNDAEADEAAIEAYKSAADQRPYLDDDEDDFPAAGRSNYSRETAGSMAQPPMIPGVAQESYGMRELNHPSGLGPGGYAADPNMANMNMGSGYSAEQAALYGAAGVGAGVGANAALQRARSQKSASSVPYHAYAGPNAWEHGGQQDPYAHSYPIQNPGPYGQGAQSVHSHNTQHTHQTAQTVPTVYSHQSSLSGGSPQDLLAAAGLNSNPNSTSDAGASPAFAAAADTHRMSSAAIAAQQRGVPLARSPSQAVTVHNGSEGLHRNKSMTLEQGYFDNAPALPSPQAYPQGQAAQVQYAPVSGHHQQASSSSNPYADIYGGVATSGQAGQSNQGNRRTSLLDPVGNIGTITPDSPASAVDAKRRSRYELDDDEYDEEYDQHGYEQNGHQMPQPGRAGLSYLDDNDAASVLSVDPAPRVLRVANE